MSAYNSYAQVDATDYSTNAQSVSNVSTSFKKLDTPVDRQGAAFVNGPFGTTQGTGAWTTPIRIDALQWVQRLHLI